MSLPYEKLGLFYLGRRYDLPRDRLLAEPLLYDSRDLVTHAVCVGMTGSGKTGLGIVMIEEAAIDGIPVLAIDPKGDLANLLLTFPRLSVDDFRPWVNAADAEARGITTEALAANEAAAWRAGLAEWDQDVSRIERLRAAADIRVLTPGSRAATPLAMLKTLTPGDERDPEEATARLGTTAASVLSLAGVADVSPVGREHVLIAALLDHAWRAGRTVDLPWLIQHVQRPPMDRVGVLDLETFYPGRERQELAVRLNGVLAAPGFDVWLSGEPLDIQALLYAADGRPRVSIVSIAHLSDAERMLVVALLLNEVRAWTRAQTGTASLRALVYLDEVFGYLPPVANPPSKAPLLTLLKQARAFGVGVMVATQNPVDLDYKALSNAGTWFLGRLQTERDKARVLDGLEGAAAGASLDRKTLDTTLSALDKRVFLLHNVQEKEPVVFQTRWTMSYLRGPMDREELGRLRGPIASEPQVSRPTSWEGDTAKPVMPAGVPEFFLPGAAPHTTYQAHLYGSARVTYSDAGRGVDVQVDLHTTTPVRAGPVPADWADATLVTHPPESLLEAPTVPDARYEPLPPAALDPRQYAGWEHEFERWVAESQRLRLLAAPRLDVISRSGEPERDFRARVRQAQHEQRDAAVERLRAKYATRLARLTERVRNAQDVVARERQQVEQQKMQTALSMGAAVIGALIGRKAVSMSTLGRATTAARGVSRASKEREDVARAETKARDARAVLEDLEREAASEIDALTASLTPDSEPIDAVEIKPTRGGVRARLVALVWVPSAALRLNSGQGLRPGSGQARRPGAGSGQA
jgi:hypothetical protein